MAAPHKIGLDYFPFQTSNPDYIETFKREKGAEGFAVVIELMQKIFGNEGYYMVWDDKSIYNFTFAFSSISDEDKIKQLVDLAVKRGIFDEPLYREHKILTSSDIQRVYIKAAERRKKIRLMKAYLLLDNNDLFDIGFEINERDAENVYIIKINANNNAKNVDINPQSKINKKENKKKENIKSSPAPDFDKSEQLTYETEDEARRRREMLRNQ